MNWDKKEKEMDKEYDRFTNRIDLCNKIIKFIEDNEKLRQNSADIGNIEKYAYHKGKIEAYKMIFFLITGQNFK